MYLPKGIGVLLTLAAMVWAADPSASRKEGIRGVYTVGVDARTGKLVRVPVARPARSTRTRGAPDRPAPAARSLPSGEEPRPTYNAVANTSFDRLIDQVAWRYQLRPSFVHAVIKTESNYNPAAVSRKGALGLMQLIPQTARRFGVNNVFDPAENVEGGVRYLRHLLDLYDDPKLTLAAYNAGEGAVDRFGGVPPYSETRQFLRRVDRFYRSFQNRDVAALPEPAPKKLDGPRIFRWVDASGIIRYTTESE